MQSFRIPGTDLTSSRLAYGCMKIGGGWSKEALTAEKRQAAYAAIDAAIGAGYTFFDHADIYCVGNSEVVFGEYLRAHPGLRDRLVIQSKCGIRAGRYDFSFDHIVSSVEGILGRLGIDRLDLLLLHRPDALCEPEEVARAFDQLITQGKVRHVGVSNHNVGQMELLRRHLRQPLVVNQLEINLSQSALIAEGIFVNQARGVPTALATGILDYCRLNGILVQAWAPTAGGRLTQVAADAPVPEVTRLLTDLAAARGVSAEAVLLAWLLRHPAGIQPVLGSTNPGRIRACAAADAVQLTREEWYGLFSAALGRKVP